MSWTHTFDFTASDGAWEPIPNNLTPDDFSSWISGQGWVGYYQPEFGDDCANQIRIAFLKETITSVTLTVVNAGSCTPYGCICSVSGGGLSTSWNPVAQGSQVYSWTGNAVTDELRIDQYNSGTNPGTIVSLVLTGAGVNPFRNEEADCSVGINAYSQSYSLDS